MGSNKMLQEVGYSENSTILFLRKQAVLLSHVAIKFTGLENETSHGYSLWA